MEVILKGSTVSHNVSTDQGCHTVPIPDLRRPYQSIQLLDSNITQLMVQKGGDHQLTW